jgi:hypothetical protein
LTQAEKWNLCEPDDPGRAVDAQARCHLFRQREIENPTAERVLFPATAVGEDTRLTIDLGTHPGQAVSSIRLQERFRTDIPYTGIW